MAKQLKDLLERIKIMYTEYTFSSNIGLSDLSVEPFTVRELNSRSCHFEQFIIIIIYRLLMKEYTSLLHMKTMQEHFCVRYKHVQTE